ncbi:MAG: hypothetical protein KO464_04195 [Candidatus Methanofastidiosum sp.]|nr:hypothetical protein [Methanofastidiosum sp.]
MKEYVFNLFKTVKAETLEESIEILLSEPIKMGDMKNFYRISKKRLVSRETLKCSSCEYEGHFGILHIDMDKFPERKGNIVTIYMCPKCLSLERIY